MKSEDIPKATKNNESDIMNGRTLHSIFSSLISPYQKNKIYQKMQREKLYNLHEIAYFLVALFVLKTDEILSDQISTVQK